MIVAVIVISNGSITYMCYVMLNILGMVVIVILALVVAVRKQVKMQLEMI